VTQPEPFEVYAIRYATMARTSAENFIGGDPHEAASRLDYFVWLARNSSHTLLNRFGVQRTHGQEAGA
jgi:hypothetical protein